MRQDSVEAVRPQCAIAATGAHIVNDEEVFLVAEKPRQTNLALSSREFVVADLLGFDRLLKLAHLAAQIGDLLPVVSQFLGSIRVLHGNHSLVRECPLAFPRFATACLRRSIWSSQAAKVSNCDCQYLLYWLIHTAA